MNILGAKKVNGGVMLYVDNGDTQWMTKKEYKKFLENRKKCGFS